MLDGPALLALQASAGNAAVTWLVTDGLRGAAAGAVGLTGLPPLAVQRQSDGPPPAVPPEDRERQIHAATTMRAVPDPDPGVKANLAKAVSFAPVYERIQARNRKRDELKAREDELDRANSELSTATESAKDVSGAPGGTDPGAGEPERAADRLKKAKTEVARLSKDVEVLGGELKDLDAVVTTQLNAVGVKNDAELVTFVEDTFPKSFADRGKQIAIAQLEANRHAAEKERDRYKAEQGAGGDRAALKAAAGDIDARTKEITAIWASRTTELPPGGADQDDPGVKELADVQARVMPKQEELEKKTAEYRLKFPILFKVDAQQIAATSDKELDALLNGPIGEVLDNIDKTEANVNDESLKVWKLRGKGANIVQLTKDDMGVVSGDTLDLVVEKYAAEDKTTGEVVTQALMALSMVADVIALVSGPMGMAVAGGLSAVAAVAQVVQDYRTFSALGAAGGVALDPDAAKMAAEEPDLEGLIYALAMAGIAALTAAGAIRNAVNEYKRVRAAAEDFEQFKKAIRATALDDATKDRLLTEAARQFAKEPIIDAAMLRRKFDAITAGFTGEEKVRVARIMSAFGSETATKTFLELEGKRIFKLTPEALDANFNAAEAARFKKQYLEARSSALGFTTKGKAFIRPGSYAQVAETAQHEFVHVLQQSYEKGYTSTIQYFMEHQAFLEQQRFLQRAHAKLGDAEFEKAFADSKWLENATDQELTAKIKERYGLAPPAHVPVSREEIDAQLQVLIETDEKRRTKVLESINKQLDRR